MKQTTIKARTGCIRHTGRNGHTGRGICSLLLAATLTLWFGMGWATQPVTQYQYDDEGNLTQITDPRTHATQRAYDALNRLTGITDAASGQTTLGYDTLDQLTSVEDARGLTTQYGYDALDDLTSLTSPDSGASQYTYDAAGNLASRTDAKSQSTSFTYDALNRLTQATYADGQSTQYTYDQGTNGLGRLTGITHTYPTGHPYAGTLTVAYTYDARGRLTTESLQLPGLTPTLTVTYQYDTDGHLTQLTYPSGRVVNYSYGPLGRIVTLATTAPGAAAQTVASAITYRAFGRVAGWTWGNSQTHSFTFDTENRLLTYPRGASAIELGYDPNSNVSSRTDSSAPTQAESFNYDALDRLTGQTDSATSRGWAYDAVGNRTSSTVGATTTSYTYSATSNRLTQIGTTPPATIVTDANGAVTDDGVNQYTYDARGRLTGATTAAGSITYLVGPRGRRLAKTTSAGTTYYVYDQAGHLIAELDSTGAPVEEHIWLNDTPLAMAQGTTLYYVDTDQLNTPRALLNSAGTVVWRWTGQAFGDSPADEDPDADSVDIAYNLRFAGQYYDRETNTFYNGARDYDPAIGRYLQSDPIGLAGGINTYAYVRNNPLKYIDADGRMPLLLGAALYYAVVYAEELTVATVVTAEIASGVPIPDLSLVSAASSAVRASQASAQTCGAAAKSGVGWNPLTGAGPLGEKVASTFRGASYTGLTTTETTTLYRAWGGSAKEIGPYWTRTAPSGPLQSTIDSALSPAWGNTATNVTKINVPAGVKIYEGFAAPQGRLVGGGSQVFIPKVDPSWIVK